MSVESTDLKCYAAEHLPTSDTGASGGGINLSAEMTGAATKECVKSAVYEPVGGSTRTHYYKFFIKNTNVVDDLLNSVVWVDNLLITDFVQDTLLAESDNAGDNSDYSLRIHGIDSSDDEIEEDLALNGTSQVESVAEWKEIHEITKIKNSDHTAYKAIGNISFSVGATPIGKIPASTVTRDYYSANGQISIAVAGTLDDTGEVTDRLTAPGGLSFEEANDEGTALDVVNSGTLTHEKAQGVWIKRVAKPGTFLTPIVQYVPTIKGDIE